MENAPCTGQSCAALGSTARPSASDSWPNLRNSVNFGIIVSSHRNAIAGWSIGTPAFAPDGRDIAAFKLQARLDDLGTWLSVLQ